MNAPASETAAYKLRMIFLVFYNFFLKVYRYILFIQKHIRLREITLRIQHDVIQTMKVILRLSFSKVNQEKSTSSI
jgi:hypothetical protein